MSSILPASGVQVNNPYQLQSAGAADNNAYQGAQSLGQYNLGGQNLGQYSGLMQQGVNNPYAGQYQQGAGVVGQQGVAAGQQAYGAGSQLEQSGLSTLPDVQALLSMGFDPQNALYARTQQQVTDQTNAQNARSGLAGTPYGQGVANQTNANFNIDWQNQQLQRAATGAGAASGLMGQAGNTIGQGAALQTAGNQEQLQGYGQSYNTFGGINANALGLLSGGAQYGQQASQIPQQQIQDYMAYLAQANQNAQTQNQATGLQLQKANAQSQELGQIANGIGSVAGFGIGGGFGSNPFAGLFGTGGNQYQPAQGQQAWSGYNATGL